VTPEQRALALEVVRRWRADGETDAGVRESMQGFMYLAGEQVPTTSADIEELIQATRPVASKSSEGPTVSDLPTDGADWIVDPELPGYAIDQHNRLKDIAGGKGRKVGRILTLVQTWVNRGKKGQAKQYQFRMYYQVTLSGTRKKIPLYEVGMRRNRLARAKAGGYRG